MARFPGIGDEFGSYSVLRMVGRGGMGVVFEARDRRLTRSVALKVLSPVLSDDQEFRTRFAHEAGVLAQLDSPNIVQIYEYGEIDGCLYLAAQLVRGQDLKTRLAELGPMPPAQAIAVAAQICDALVDAYDAGVVHRDVKPSNVLLRERAGSLQVYLCDFGIAATEDSEHTSTGQIVGSRTYMAPERHRGERADIRTDLYALGCVLWECLQGAPPFPGVDVEVALGHLNDPIPQLAGTDPISQRINTVLLKALSKKRADRYQDPHEFRAALAGLELFVRARSTRARPREQAVAPVTAAASTAPLQQPPAPPPPAPLVEPRRDPPRPSVPTTLGPIPMPRTEPPLPAAEKPPAPAAEKPPAPLVEPPAPLVEPRRDPARDDPRPAPRSPRGRRTPLLIGLVLALLAGLAATYAFKGGVGSSAAKSGAAGAAGTDSSWMNVEVFRPSTRRGGTVRLVMPDDWKDTFDPGFQYTVHAWDLSRAYARTLVMLRPGGGAAGDVLVPDLATTLGRSSDGGRTWTYTLKKGLRFEDGRPITAATVKFGILRSTAYVGLFHGPVYFERLLAWPKGWQGQALTPGMNTDSAIEVHGTSTIVFHLRRPMASFDYLAQQLQTAPVPLGSPFAPEYEKHVISSGPYRFAGSVTAAGPITLVRNPRWDRRTDPNRPALPDRYSISFVPNLQTGLATTPADGIDPLTGLGVDQVKTALADRTLAPRLATSAASVLEYVGLNPTVAPLNNPDCRRAIGYAVDHRALQGSFGGPRVTEPATTMLSPVVAGYTSFDRYGARSHPAGDRASARAALRACGRPGGFSVSLGYQTKSGTTLFESDRKVATVFRDSLARVGIRVTLKPLDSDSYLNHTCGVRSYVAANGIGMCVISWIPDWNEGYGFFAALAGGTTDPAAPYSNLAVDDPAITRLFDQVSAEGDRSAREQGWGRIDRAMVDSGLVYPIAHLRRLLVRPSGLTNLVVSRTFVMYDFLRLGVRG